MHFLSLTIDPSDPYILILGATAVIILSFLYSEIARKTKIPSVLMLILTGILAKLGIDAAGITEPDLMPALEILGIIGVIMIVLESALELELDKNKLVVIGKALLISLLTLIGTAMVAALIIQYLTEAPYLNCMLYAIPLGILSSVILIPSIQALPMMKKEGLIYETSFSDILGIMEFYFLINLMESGGTAASIAFSVNLLITIVVAIAASYGLVFLFKDLQGKIRLFLLIAVLLLLYSLGELLELSPLLIILVFGLLLANHQTFFRIFRDFDQDEDPVERIGSEFLLISKETSFVIRTFFFVIFGMTIELSSLVDLEVFLISLAVLGVIYVVRFIVLRLLLGKDLIPEVWLAPRGLVTILLYFAIPVAYQMEGFSNGVLLYVIILTSLIMTFALVRYKPAAAVTEEQQALEEAQINKPEA